MVHSRLGLQLGHQDAWQRVTARRHQEHGCIRSSQERCGNGEDCRHLGSLHYTHKGLSTCKCVFAAFSVDHTCSGIDEPARVVAVPAAVEGSPFPRHFNIHQRLQTVGLLACVPREYHPFFESVLGGYCHVSTLYVGSANGDDDDSHNYDSCFCCFPLLLPSCGTIHVPVQTQTRRIMMMMLSIPSIMTTTTMVMVVMDVMRHLQTRKIITMIVVVVAAVAAVVMLHDQDACC